MRRLVLVVTAGAMLAGSIPVAAKDRSDRRDDDRRHHHRRDRDTSDGAAGGFVLGALAVGLIAALSSKKPAVAPEVVADTGAAPIPAQTDIDAAVSACADAVEGEGRRSFALAQAGLVRAAVPFEQGYAIEGDVLLRSGWRDAGVRRGFRCTVDAEAVRTVAIEGVRTLPPRP